MGKQVSNKEIEQDRRMLERISRLMDNAFRVPGTQIQFGWDSIIGLIPGAGDFITSAPLLYYLSIARKYKMGRRTQLRLAGNQLLDFLIGLIPLIGDLFDIGFKSNFRNTNLLLRKLDQHSGIIDVEPL